MSLNSPSKVSGSIGPLTTTPSAGSSSSLSSIASSSHSFIPINDEKDKERERKLAEQRSINALKLQRKQRLEALIRKRKGNLQYLKKVHEGNSFWFNSVLLTKEDLQKFVHSLIPKQRIESYFLLGLSIAKILLLPPGTQTVRAISQLMEEWEYYNAGSTFQSMKYVMAKTSPCIYPNTVPIEGMSDLTRPTIYKFNNTVVYEFLQVFPIAFELDYREVIITLCDILLKLYENFFHQESFSNQVVYDTIVRLDTRVKHHFINLIAKEFTELSIMKMKENTSELRHLSGAKALDV